MQNFRVAIKIHKQQCVKSVCNVRNVKHKIYKYVRFLHSATLLFLLINLATHTPFLVLQNDTGSTRLSRKKEVIEISLYFKTIFKYANNFTYFHALKT